MVEFLRLAMFLMYSLWFLQAFAIMLAMFLIFNYPFVESYMVALQTALASIGWIILTDNERFRHASNT